MKANLKIERIGRPYMNIDYELIVTCKALKDCTGINLLEGIPKNRDWVAQILGRDPKYKYRREFLRPKVDYTRSNSVGSRGVYANYILEDGQYYEVKAPLSWRHSEQYFCTVENGSIRRVTKEEVDEWLKLRLE